MCGCQQAQKNMLQGFNCVFDHFEDTRLWKVNILKIYNKTYLGQIREVDPTDVFRILSNN